MGLLDNYSGIGMSPRPAAMHQDIIGNICYELRTLDIFCRSEFCIDATDLNSLAPDIVIYSERDDRYPVTIFEITTSKEFNTICDKVQELMRNYDHIQESFVYDYEKGFWKCYGPALDLKFPSYSECFGIHLADII